MMIRKRIAIVGAGISGLTMAYNINRLAINKSIPILVDVLQSQPKAGGRIRTTTIPKEQNQNKYNIFDIGANLIDFQNQQSRADWSILLPEHITKKLTQFKKPFLIYEHKTSQLRKGDYQKQRYYYQGGFDHLVRDVIQSMEAVGHASVNVRYGCEVIKLEEKDGQVEVDVKDINTGYIENSFYNQVFLSCPPPKILQILANSPQSPHISQQLHQIHKRCQNTKYTTQISVCMATKTPIQDFSCILFKQHPIITFICSHQEKYGSSGYVVQTTEQFTQRYYKEDIELCKQKIFWEVYDVLPEQVKKITKKQYGGVHYWSVSLIKSSNKQNLQDKNKLIHIIGDAIIGKSRVSGAVQSVKYCIPKL